ARRLSRTTRAGHGPSTISRMSGRSQRGDPPPKSPSRALVDWPPNRARRTSVYERALVPLDGSIVAEGVIPFILQTAGPLDLDVTLLRVVVPAPPAVVEAGPIVVDDTEKVCAEAEVYLA